MPRPRKEDKAAKAGPDGDAIPAAPSTEAPSKSPKKDAKKKGDTPKEVEPVAENNDASSAAADSNDAAKKPTKPKKRTVPMWASRPNMQNGGLAATGSRSAAPSSGDAVALLEEAVRLNADSRGAASAMAIKKHVRRHRPDWPKMTYKTAMKRAVAKKRIVQVRGKGLAGSFKLGSGSNANQAPSSPSKKNKKSGKASAAASASGPSRPLEDLFPNVFTWVCEPKEASSQLIKKYISKHHSRLDVEGKAFKRALEAGVAKGQLDQITGRGSSGTFQLVDGARKFGTAFEDAIEDAIIAMNEPKDASVQGLRHYLSEYHTEYKVADRPKVLRRALDRAEEKGWVTRVSGKGFTGSFRLAHPHYPSPRELWGEWYEEEDEDEDEGRKKRKRASRKADSSDEEEDDESEEDSSDDEVEEVVPKKKSRGPPKKREAAAPKKKKATAAKGRGRPPKKAAAASTPAKKKLKVPGKKRR